MKKKLRINLIICLLAGLLTSCGNKKSKVADVNASLTLALRSGVYADVIKAQVKDFENENNVSCTILELGEDELHQRIASDAGIVAGSYDLCMVDGSWVAEYASKGLLADLTQMGYDLDNDVIPATKTICYQNGKLYLVPYYGNVTVLLYNRLFVKEAGYTPDQIDSLDDIMKICEITKKRHNLGFMFRGDTANNIVVDFLPILRSFGGWVVNENNQPTVNTPVFKQAMKFYLDLIETGRGAKKNDLIAAIANKSAAIGIGWPGWYTPTNNSSMDYIALSGKKDADSPAYNANVYGIWTLGIPSNSQNKEYAIKLLSYLMEPERQKDSVNIGGVPCRYSSLRDSGVLAKFPQYEAVGRALESGVYRPVMTQWTSFYTVLGKEMDLIIKGEKSIDEGLDDAQIQIKSMLSVSSER
ncbi:extracellular solute-binding protein [Treponema sp. C6A8]|uniref:extracellular solute-binding protein n=1 Tax=Treponema sp. C6A8 TaxID=1410609 RepID=UPI00056E31FC|nr:extracellular solute-binding protein [Treponema sp. C6A8]